MSRPLPMPGLLGPLEPLAPWDYLRLRREAAGLTIAQAAKPYWKRPEHAADVERNIRQAETPGFTIRHDYLIDDYTRAFPMDSAVYRQLRDEPADHHPKVCRGCGCTAWQACICPSSGNDCTIGDDMLCTACHERAEARQPRRRAA